ncbi:MAG: hypothetical protein M3Q34_01355 [bacterium]|nr:hypothetical protein [bacterium]
MQNNEIQNLIKELIGKIVPTDKDIEVIEDGKSKTTWFKIETRDPYLFLNREGEALHALNYIARKLVEAKTFPQNKKREQNEQLLPSSQEHVEILIDINGFHKKKIENIHAIVHMMAERARYFKSSIEIDPMPAFERRIVHEFLSDASDLKTESEGVGPYRRVVIKYVGGL